MCTFFIPGNVPSSKNSKVWTGRFLVTSATTKRYEKQAIPVYESHAAAFKEITATLPRPLQIHFLFVRDSKRKFDYINPAQTVQDLMVRTGWLTDDNADEILPLFLPYRYDKQNPGVYIYIQTPGDTGF